MVATIRRGVAAGLILIQPLRPQAVLLQGCSCPVMIWSSKERRFNKDLFPAAARNALCLAWAALTLEKNDDDAAVAANVANGIAASANVTDPNAATTASSFFFSFHHRYGGRFDIALGNRRRIKAKPFSSPFPPFWRLLAEAGLEWSRCSRIRERGKDEGIVDD